ncbi:sugar ABC transporter permease [Streptomyces sp. NPDC020422]|uniref:sugar ABC transporter permease n=1 Tax=unclassified Streptomyces TaxID=2593676 RepID=UPI0036FB3EAD
MSDERAGRGAAAPPDWAGKALGLLLDRVGRTAEQVGTRFPLYAEPGDGRWTTTVCGTWTGGFWAGLLWLRARHRAGAGPASPADARAASACTARLARWVGADTATRGLILWYGTALAVDDQDAAALRARAARTVLAAWEPRLGLVPWGAALGGERLRARADGVPGLVPLLACAGPEGHRAAEAHLLRHLELCLPGDHRRPRPAWRYDEAGAVWTPEAEPGPGWTRGEAWLLLAVADGLLHGGAARAERLAEAAEQLLCTGQFLHGPLVPPAHARHRDGPLDTSAAAIAAVALRKLALVPGAPWAAACAVRSEAVLHRLAHAHLTRPGSRRPGGMLLDGCYDTADRTAVWHELVWGDFFLALGLAALCGEADLRSV